MQKKYGNISLPRYIKPYITVVIILGIIVILVVGTFLVWISFDKSNLLLFYLLREIGKAIIITGLVSTAINWYFKHHWSLLEKEK